MLNSQKASHIYLSVLLTEILFSGMINVVLYNVKARCFHEHAMSDAMKKAAITILTFLISVSLVSAQKEYKKWVAGVNVGISVPFADFANKKMIFNAGFASPGANADIDFFRYTGKCFGLSSTIGYANIFFNEKAYQSEYSYIPNLEGQTTVDAGNYQILKGLLGFVIKIPETRHIEVLISLQAGYAMSVHPELLVTNTELGEINSIKRNIAWSPMSSAGLKINYYLSEKYGVSLNYNLNFTKPWFSDETSIEKGFTLPIRYQNINIGFVRNL